MAECGNSFMLKYHLRLRVDDGPVKSVVEVFNHSPFSYKNRNFMSVNGQKLFEIFNTGNGNKGLLKTND